MKRGNRPLAAFQAGEYQRPTDARIKTSCKGFLPPPVMKFRE